jgi:hypothetical protein
MKAGDLVVYKGIAHFNLPIRNKSEHEDYWIVLGVTKQKKTWHRSIFLFDGSDIINIPWNNRESFEVISEAD